MVGIPDGLGRLRQRRRHVHRPDEPRARRHAGIVRAHGATGAFVSKWIDRQGRPRGAPRRGPDPDSRDSGNGHGVRRHPTTGHASAGFCSADLPAPSAFYDAATGHGYDGRLFMNGEESGDEGRAFAHGHGRHELASCPALGKFRWENAVAQPGRRHDRRRRHRRRDARPGLRLRRHQADHRARRSTRPASPTARSTASR